MTIRTCGLRVSITAINFNVATSLSDGGVGNPLSALQQKRSGVIPPLYVVSERGLPR